MRAERQVDTKRIIKAKWYERFLPFVAKQPAAKIDWLVEVFGARSLGIRDITPYIRLLTMDIAENRGEMAALFVGLDDKVIHQMIEAADIYDTPEIFGLIPEPGVSHALIALHKTVPPYEKNPQQVLNRIYQAIYNHSPKLLQEAVECLRRGDDLPPHFNTAYSLFEEVLADEQLLQSLFPQARKRE